MMTLTRDRILEAALRLIVSDGPRRASIAELARRLGVVKSALYYHFPGGKEEIVREVFEHEERAILSAISRAIGRASGARERLAALVRATAAHILRVARLYPVSEDASDEIEEFLAARRREFLARERALIASVLRDGVTSGDVREVDADLVAAAVQGALRQVVRAYALRPGAQSTRLLAGLVDVVFDGIGGRQ